MDHDFLRLQDAVSAFSSLSENEWLSFKKLWEPINAKRKAILTHSGEQEKYLYFVLEGVQRVFYQDAVGRDATLVFTYVGSFGSVLDSMLLHKPALYSYETLTASRFLRVKYASLEELAENSNVIKRFIEVGVLGAFSGVLERLVQLQCFSSEEKFKALLSRSPHMLNLVPHKYLANYLGIDPTNFSKFINQKLI